MGGSISKSGLTKNNSGIEKMNKNIEKVMQQTLAKYSEMIKAEMGSYYQKLIGVMKEPGLSPPPQPKIDLAQTFGQKCNQDLVAIFEKKLDKFPKYALEKSSLFGTSLTPIMMDLADRNGIQKQTLCKNLSQMYAAFLGLVENSVRGLMGCRMEMDAVIARLSQSFQSVSGPSGPIAESKANLAWFTKMGELQKSYTTQLKKVDKFMKKLNGVTVMGPKKLNKLIAEMNKLSTENQQLPGKCSALANELKTMQTIDSRTANECKRLNIAEAKCNKNAIDVAIRALEQGQRLAAQQLAQRRTNLSSVPSAISSASAKARQQ